MPLKILVMSAMILVQSLGQENVLDNPYLQRPKTAIPLRPTPGSYPASFAATEHVQRVQPATFGAFREREFLRFGFQDLVRDRATSPSRSSRFVTTSTPTRSLPGPVILSSVDSRRPKSRNFATSPDATENSNSDVENVTNNIPGTTRAIEVRSEVFEDDNTAVTPLFDIVTEETRTTVQDEDEGDTTQTNMALTLLRYVLAQSYVTYLDI